MYCVRCGRAPSYMNHAMSDWSSNACWMATNCFKSTKYLLIVTVLCRKKGPMILLLESAPQMVICVLCSGSAWDKYGFSVPQNRQLCPLTTPSRWKLASFVHNVWLHQKRIINHVEHDIRGILPSLFSSNWYVMLALNFVQ